MIVCPQCQHHNPEGVTNCVSCGASLERAAYRACPACKALNARVAVYCHRCFAPLDDKVQETLDSAPPVRPPTARREPTARPSRVAPRVAPGATRVEPGAPIGDASGGQEGGGAAEPASHTPVDRNVEADPIASLRDALPLEPSILDWRGALPDEAPATSGELRAAELFRRIATERAPLSEGKVRVAPERPRRLGRRGRAHLFLLVLAAALVPQFCGAWTSALVSPRPAVEALAAQMRALSAGQPVLVSFDYAASSAGELAPAAVTLLGQLVRQDVPFLVVGGNPAGLGLANQVLAEVEMERGAPLVYGTDYLLLGYLSGDVAGLQVLATRIGDAFPADAVEGRPLTEYPMLSADDGLGGARHVLVLADETITVRRWIEQVATRNDAHYHALVTARIEPMLTPYRRSGQLSTLVSGVAGAVELPVAIDPKSRASALSDGLAALAVLVCGVALATNLVPLFRRGRER